MTEIKQGDKVMCIDPDYRNVLELNKVYTVERTIEVFWR
jgi:hypothetical protein